MVQTERKVEAANTRLEAMNTTIEGFQASIQRLGNQFGELLKATSEKEKNNEQEVEVPPNDAIEEEKGRMKT